MPGPAATRRPRILIVDDHQLIRQAMAATLRGAFEAADIIEAETFAEARERFVMPGVFLAIVDLSIPGMGSPRDLAQLRRLRPSVKLVVLSGSEARSDILAALEAGVHGFIQKRSRTEQLLAHLSRVLDGEIYVPPMLAELEEQPPTRLAAPSASPIRALTKRQREVLALVGQGLSNKEIGQRLDVAEGTVKMHVATILRTIDAKNRVQAAAIGRKYRADDAPG